MSTRSHIQSQQQPETEVISVHSPMSKECTTEECEQFREAKQQFQIFVTPNSTYPTQQHFQSSHTSPLVSGPLCETAMTNGQQQQDEQQPCQLPIDLSPNLTQEPLQMNFTQGTTQLSHDLIITIPDQHYIDDNMEHIQQLLYVEPTLTLQELVLCVSFLLQNGRYAADMSLVENVLQRYDADSGDFKPFTYIDPELQYTRNLIATDNKNWTLLLLCWNPHTSSPIHNHPNCECFVRMLENSLTEYRYHHPDNNNSNFSAIQSTTSNGCDVTCAPNASGSKFSTKDDSQLQCFSMAEARAGMVTLMNDDLGLHKLENKSDSIAYTLHLYFPPYNSCKIYLNASRVATISNICYHSIRGELNFFNGVFEKTSADFDDGLVDISK